MSQAFDVVVVGAGITGASTAYHLRKRGVERVLLVEREAPAAGGTGKSAAIIRQHYSTPVLSGLTRDTVAMLSRMEEELGQPSGFVQSGWYFLVPEEMREQAERNLVMQQQLGIETGQLTERCIIETMPWLNREGVDRVIHEPLGGYADPVQATEAYVAGFEALGGDFVWFGIITVIGAEIGLLTPPLGISCFTIKSTIKDPSITLSHIFMGAFPFAFIMLLVLIAVVAFPQLSLMLL